MNINKKFINLLNSFKMGSSSASSESGAFAKEFKVLEWNKCNHDGYCRITKHIYLRSVPLISKGAYVGATVGRVIGQICTFGLSEIGYDIYKLATGAGDGLNHYFLEMSFECNICHEFRTYTIDFTNDSEKNIRCGYYQYRTKDLNKKSGYWSFNEIERIIKDIPEKKYNITTYNCQHFAIEVFYRLL